MHKWATIYRVTSLRAYLFQVQVYVANLMPGIIC